MIIDELVELVRPQCKGRSLAEIRVGLGYTAVCLDDGACGLAYTFREEARPGCSVLREAGTFRGRTAAEMLAWATRFNAVEAAVGVATLNALIEPSPMARTADVLADLQLGQEDVVGMVGYFGPLVKPIRRQASKLRILERRPVLAEGVLPDWTAPAVLPECSIVILTATSLLNRTLDGLLACCGRAREVILLGPTTPLTPGIFGKKGVTLLSGVHVTDPNRLLQVIGEGGGTRSFGKAVSKLTIRVRK